MQNLACTQDEPRTPSKQYRRDNGPSFDLHDRLFKMCGVDLTRIDGINVTTALTVVAEVDTDLSRFRTDKHFALKRGVNASRLGCSRQGLESP